MYAREGLLEEGMIYWTYFFEKTGCKTKCHTGIFQVEFLRYDKKIYEGTVLLYPKFNYINKDIIIKWGVTLKSWIYNYLENYCFFSENKKEIIEHHDNRLINITQKATTNERKIIYKKLINKKSIPLENPFETKAKKWFKNLSALEQHYVEWIGNYHDEYYKDMKALYEGFNRF